MKSFEHPLLVYLKDKKFVLASTSPRRLEIIQSLQIPNVEVVGSNFEEDLDKADYTPGDYVIATALGKAQAVWDDFISQKTDLPDVLLAADTVVECNGRIFEKPKSVQENIENIKWIRDTGVSQRVLTGIIIFVKKSDGVGYELTKHLETTYIDMDAEISDSEIQLYCETEEGMGVAGGYRIQGYGALFMKEVRGDYYNVVGLPFRTTFRLLEKLLNITTH